LKARKWITLFLKHGHGDSRNVSDGILAGNVANMSRHVGQDTTCCSNFGQMGPCRRHKIEDVVTVCVSSSRHLPDFPKCVSRNILWYGSTYAQKLSHPHACSQRSFLSCSPFCHVLQFDMFWRVTMHTHTTPTRYHKCQRS